METETSNFEKLIDEFSNIKVEIEIGPQKFCDGDSPEYDEDGILDYPIYYDFYLKFQNEDKVYYNTVYVIGDAYLRNLDKLRLNFYKEINNEIVPSSNKFNTLNLLSEYKIRFSELLDNYYDDHYNGPNDPNFFKNNKIIQYHYSEILPIRDFSRRCILNQFLIIQIRTIEKILRYLEEKIDLIKFQSHEENYVSKPAPEKHKSIQRIYEKESFELDPDLFDSDSAFAEKINNFKETLYKSDYITQIDNRFFIKVFKNQKIIQPIVWKGTPNELYYLIKNLYDQNIIIHFKNYWDVACKCFLAYDKRSNVVTAYRLQRCKKPTRTDQLRKLNSVISTLK